MLPAKICTVYTVQYSVNTGEIDNEREERPDQKVDVAFGNFFELISIFEEASRNSIFIFSFNRPG